MFGFFWENGISGTDFVRKKGGCLTKRKRGSPFSMDKEHTKNTRNHKGIGHLQYNVGDETNTKPAVQL